MYQLVMKSRWFAALWALATLASVAIYVSKGGGAEKMEATARAVHDGQNSARMQREPEDSADLAERSEMSDNQGIDRTVGADTRPGLDPVPVNPTPENGSEDEE